VYKVIEKIDDKGIKTWRKKPYIVAVKELINKGKASKHHIKPHHFIRSINKTFGLICSV
jgi:hypothetical protein